LNCEAGSNAFVLAVCICSIPIARSKKTHYSPINLGRSGCSKKNKKRQNREKEKQTRKSDASDGGR